MIRLYGHQKGESSFVQVTRGMRVAARAVGLLAGEVAVDLTDDERCPAGADATVALHCGAPLTSFIGHRMGLHRKHWLMLAPNSEGIPPRVAQQLHELVPSFVAGSTEALSRPLLDGLLAPSMWACHVLKRMFPEHDVRLAPHGVHPEVHCPLPETSDQNRKGFAAGEFRVLHFTSTMGQRKGTAQLLEAWRAWKDRPAKAHLLIIANPLAVNDLAWRSHEMGVDMQTVDIVANPGAPMSAVAAALRGAHIVCQPSRGEAFGILPVESRACGTPIVATACTGHSEHVQAGDPGVVVVPHGALEPIDDYPSALAPSVQAADVLEALRSARAQWNELSEAAMANANTVRREWSWERKNAPVLKVVVDDAR